MSRMVFPSRKGRSHCRALGERESAPRSCDPPMPNRRGSPRPYLATWLNRYSAPVLVMISSSIMVEPACALERRHDMPMGRKRTRPSQARLPRPAEAASATCT